MRLYHQTTRAAALTIAADGFGCSHLADRPRQSSLAASIAHTRPGGGWLVIVELPDEVAALYPELLEGDEQYMDCYLVPWEVLNAHMPFTLAPAPPPAL